MMNQKQKARQIGQRSNIIASSGDNIEWSNQMMLEQSNLQAFMNGTPPQNNGYKRYNPKGVRQQQYQHVPNYEHQISDSKTIVQTDEDQQEVNQWKSQVKSQQIKDINERTVYVADLLPSHTDNDLHLIFHSFGSVKITKIPGKRYGYVVFGTQDMAKFVLNCKQDFMINGHVIRVAVNSKPQELDPNANLLIRNLEVYVNEQLLKKRFEEFGEIISCKVARDESTGKSLCYAYLQFKTVASASLAIDRLNNTYWEEEYDPDLTYKKNKKFNLFNKPNTNEGEVKGKKMSITVFKRRDQYMELKAMKEGRESNLYVKNLGPDFGDSDLKDLFKSFGNIKSAKIRRDKETGMPLGCGFVDFEDPDEASRAILKLNGCRLQDFGNRIITVEMATCKSRRQRKKLEQQQQQQQQHQETQESEELIDQNNLDSGTSSMINGDNESLISDCNRSVALSTPFTQASSPALATSPSLNGSVESMENLVFKRASSTDRFELENHAPAFAYNMTSSAPMSTRSSPVAELPYWNMFTSFSSMDDLQPPFGNELTSQLPQPRFSQERFEANLRYGNQYSWF